MDFFGGSLSSVLAALHLSVKMIVFDKDDYVLELARSRVMNLARRLTNQVGGDLAAVREGLKKNGNGIRYSMRSDALLEYRFVKILNDSELRYLHDPNFGDAYDLVAALAHYGLEVKDVSDEHGEGLFATRTLPAGSLLCNVMGVFVQREMTRLKANIGNEYVIFPDEDRAEWAIEMSINQVASKINDYRVMGTHDASVGVSPNCEIGVQHITYKYYKEGEGDVSDRGFVYFQVNRDADVQIGEQLLTNWRSEWLVSRKRAGPKAVHEDVNEDEVEDDEEEPVPAGPDEVDDDGKKRKKTKKKKKKNMKTKKGTTENKDIKKKKKKKKKKRQEEKEKEKEKKKKKNKKKTNINAPSESSKMNAPITVTSDSDSEENQPLIHRLKGTNRRHGTSRTRRSI
jgi:hypothetical protein